MAASSYPHNLGDRRERTADSGQRTASRRTKTPGDRGLDACIALCNAECMTQLVTRVNDNLVSLVDELVEEGVVESRSDAVRRGLRVLVDQQRRLRIGEAVVQGYRDRPQNEGEVGWADIATVKMIGEEPW